MRAWSVMRGRKVRAARAARAAPAGQQRPQLAPLRHAQGRNRHAVHGDPGHAGRPHRHDLPVQAAPQHRVQAPPPPYAIAASSAEAAVICTTASAVRRPSKPCSSRRRKWTWPAAITTLPASVPITIPGIPSDPYSTALTAMLTATFRAAIAVGSQGRWKAKKVRVSSRLAPFSGSENENHSRPAATSCVQAAPNAPCS